MATSALPQGCRHGLCQLRDSPRLSPLGPEGPRALEGLEEIKLGLIPLCTLFGSPSNFPTLGLSLTDLGVSGQRAPNLLLPFAEQ